MIFFDFNSCNFSNCAYIYICMCRYIVSYYVHGVYNEGMYIYVCVDTQAHLFNQYRVCDRMPHIIMVNSSSL